MTEVKQVGAASAAALGLFATRSYQAGDVIVHEPSPLVRLAVPTSQEQDILDHYSHLFGESKASSTSTAASKKVKRGRPKNDDDDYDDNDANKNTTTLWESIVVPETVKTEHAGKFKGMVVAGLCFQQQQQQQQQQLDSSTVNRLLQLYHPDLSSPTRAEREILQVAKLARDLVVASSPSNNNNNKKNEVETNDNTDERSDDDDKDDDSTLLLKVMLIWTCNAFDGGRLYNTISRINHSCSPNAVVVVVGSSSSSDERDGMEVRAATDISAGQEVTISYLSLLLYAQRSVRRKQLLATKHFDCRCSRCSREMDAADTIPCPSCHARIPATGHRQLEEDVQYDDDGTVAYAVATKKRQEESEEEEWFYECAACQSTFAIPSDDDKINDKRKKTQSQKQQTLGRPLYSAMQQVVQKVVNFIQDHEKSSGHQSKNDSDADAAAANKELQDDLLQEHVALASSIMGARHWTTNLLLLLQVDAWLHDIHGKLLLRATGNSSGGTDDNNDDNNDDALLLESIAQTIDGLQRLVKFVNGLSAAGGELLLHRGHLLSSVILGTVRALTSLGDGKSQRYASEWIKQLDNDDDGVDGESNNFITQFESPGMQKVVAALRAAWTRNAATVEETAQDAPADASEKDKNDGQDRKRLKKG